MKKTELMLERTIYMTRWLLAPVYLGLSLALIALVIKFFQELFYLFVHILSFSDIDLILILLSLIDIVLVGGLLLMVMFRGYENFVSTIDIPKDQEKLNWMGKMDAGGLKNKVAVSIVAISSIHLLKVFMNTEQTDAEHLKWYVVIHMTLVASSCAMGFLDWATRHHPKT